MIGVAPYRRTPGPRAEARTPEDWAVQIDECIALLEELNRKTEDDFMAVGSQLQQIHMRTRGISESLTAVMTSFSDDDRNALIGQLRRIMEAASRYLNNFGATSSRAVTQLSGLMEIVEELPETLREFERLVSQLRIMGIATRIETERLGLTALGFEHLAEEVTMLGETISHKAKEVQSGIRAIAGIVRSTEAGLTRLRQSHLVLQDSVSQNIASDMQLLSEKHEVLMNVVDNISIKSQDSMQTINHIVEAIQFHDITRQQIEHVIGALKDLRRHEGEGSSETPLSHLIVVCELQPVQLKRAHAKYTNAVLAMISSFGSLTNTIDVMQAEAKEAVGFAGGDGTTFFGVVGTNLQSVTSALAEGEQVIGEFLASLGQISLMVRKMNAYMEEMSEVGIEIELLALNSRIRSAKALERGAALGVIAESIQRISTSSRAHVDLVIRTISSLVAATEAMEEDARHSATERSAETTVEDMTRNLKAMITMFESGSASGSEILRRTERLAGELGAELSVLAGTVRKSRDEANIMLHIEELLASLARGARAEAPEIVLEDVEARLEELRERYTMHSERDIHEAYLEGRSGERGAEDQPAESSIELF